MGSGRNIRKLSIAIVAFYLIANMSHVWAAGLAWSQNPKERIDLGKKGVINANKTGYTGVQGFEGEFNGYLRNLEGQKVHSNFFLNTNSCASCHSTHNGQSESLLFQSSVYNTCTTCHFDATMNTYNVLAGNGQVTDLLGGRFYDEAFSMSGRVGVSYHLSTGKLQVKDAPGYTGDALWGNQPFTCGSCHAPHGSYNPRHLNVNVNGQAKRFSGLPLIAAQGKPGQYVPNVSGLENTALKDTLPWLYYGSDSEYFSKHGLVIKNGSGQDVTDKFFVHYRDGYVQVRPDLEDDEKAVVVNGFNNGGYTISFSRAMLVDLDVIKQGGKETSNYRSGTVEFCTACHSGYLGKNEQEQIVINHGVDSALAEKKWTHVFDQNLMGDERVSPDSRLKLERGSATDERLVCLTCHVAHGTDASLMLDRNFELMYSEEAEITYDTHNLRFGKAGDYWEVCYTCHDPANPPLPAAGAGEETGDETTVGAEEEPVPKDATSNEPQAEAAPTEQTPLPDEPKPVDNNQAEPSVKKDEDLTSDSSAANSSDD